MPLIDSPFPMPYVCTTEFLGLGRIVTPPGPVTHGGELSSREQSDLPHPQIIPHPSPDRYYSITPKKPFDPTSRNPGPAAGKTPFGLSRHAPFPPLREGTGIPGRDRADIPFPPPGDARVASKIKRDHLPATACVHAGLEGVGGLTRGC
jgi:hypothetical protein